MNPYETPRGIGEESKSGILEHFLRCGLWVLLLGVLVILDLISVVGVVWSIMSHRLDFLIAHSAQCFIITGSLLYMWWRVSFYPRPDPPPQ